MARPAGHIEDAGPHHWTPARGSCRPGHRGRWRGRRRASGKTTYGTTSRPLLIASGADVKTVPARLRHTSAKTTLDTYGHLWPDRDESTRAAVEAVSTERADSPRTKAGQQ